jgi:hypothetical protein
MSKQINPEKLSKFDRQYLRDRGIDPDEYVARMTATDEPDEVEDDTVEEGEAILSDGTNVARAGRLPRDNAEPVTPTDEDDPVAAQGGDAAEAAEDDEEDGDEEDVPYSEWSNDELRKELRDRDLSTEGKKADLIARLEEHDASSE